MSSLEVLGTGMVTGVGLSSPSTCAAIRCGVSGFEETRFMFDGDWQLGCEVPLEPAFRGRSRLVGMASMAIEECLQSLDGIEPNEIPLLLAIAEKDRPGRLAGVDDSLIDDVEQRLGVRFHDWSRVFASGRIGGAEALVFARRAFAGGCHRAIVAGVDSLLVAASLKAFHARRSLLTSDNSNGFIPGEAAAAIALGPPGSAGLLSCAGVGLSSEPAPLGSGNPFRAQGMVEAVQAALEEARWTLDQVDLRIADLNGVQYGFKEAALMLTRVLRKRKQAFELWHPADCVGETGAAAIPLMISVAATAVSKGYSAGPRVIVHSASDGVLRAAIALERVGRTG